VQETTKPPILNFFLRLDRLVTTKPVRIGTDHYKFIATAHFSPTKQNNMASSSSRFLNTSLSFIFFFFLISNNIPPSFSSPTHRTTTDLISFSSTAEKLIRGLNLFPKDPINTLHKDSLIVAGNIVEKKLTFPSLVGPGSSVEELGHHAGYYSLPRSKAAR